MNFKKSKIRSLVLLALAAVAFCGLIWFANKDRPVYRSSNMAGTDYEVGRVLRVWKITRRWMRRWTESGGEV